MTIGYTHPKRLPRINRDSLDPDAQQIFDLIDNTRGGVWGPYTALMQVPELANRVASVGEYLRFHGVLPGHERELAILAAARENNSKFEWRVHEPVALKEGTNKKAIEAIRMNESTKDLPAREDLIVQIIRSLSREKSIKDDLYNKAQETFSKEELIELTTIAGFYQLLAYVISAFDVPEPESDLASF